MYIFSLLNIIIFNKHIITYFSILPVMHYIHNLYTNMNVPFIKKNNIFFKRLVFVLRPCYVMSRLSENERNRPLGMLIGGLNQTKHCGNVWLQCIDSNVRSNRWWWIIYGTGLIPTPRQTIGRHGLIHTCMGRNYKKQQDESCCL